MNPHEKKKAGDFPVCISPGKKGKEWAGQAEVAFLQAAEVAQCRTRCISQPTGIPAASPQALCKQLPDLHCVSLSAATPLPDTRPCQASSISPQSTLSGPQLPARHNALLLPSGTLPSQIHHTASQALVGFLSGCVSQHILSAPFHPLL